MGFFSDLFGGKTADLSGATNAVNAGTKSAIGGGATAGRPDGDGYIQQWHKQGVDQYVKPGLDATSWSNGAAKTALGGNGGDASRNYWGGFMQNGPLQAAMQQAGMQTQARQNAMGLSNSGSMDQAMANTQARMGYGATQDQLGHLFRQQGLAGTYANAGLNANNQAAGQIANVGVSSANALAGIQQNQALSDQAAHNGMVGNILGLGGSIFGAAGKAGGFSNLFKV